MNVSSSHPESLPCAGVDSSRYRRYMSKTTAYGLVEGGTNLSLVTIDRRGLRPDDVAISVTFCGVCHSDIHAIESAARDGRPLIPGHEFVGTVLDVGRDVKEFLVGDAVAVGNIVDSCGVCDACLSSEESYCFDFPTTTYGGVDRVDGSITQGAYSHAIVVRDRFVYRLPQGLDPAGVAPLMCAGITVWQPLSRYGVGARSRVGIVGLGGLGHLAVKFAKALGAHVAVFTTSAGKADAALVLGADEVIVSTDESDMARHVRAFDLVLDTASTAHDLDGYARTLDFDGVLCMLGIPPRYSIGAMALLTGRRHLTASGSGGRGDTQAMLEFAALHGIIADVEILPSGEVLTALERLSRNDVRWRFVLDFSQ